MKVLLGINNQWSHSDICNFFMWQVYTIHISLCTNCQWYLMVFFWNNYKYLLLCPQQGCKVLHSACLYACLYVCPYLKNHMSRLHEILGTCQPSHGSVLFWQQCYLLCTSGFVDVCAYWPTCRPTRDVLPQHSWQMNSFATAIRGDKSASRHKHTSIIHYTLFRDIIIWVVYWGRSLLSTIALLIFCNWTFNREHAVELNNPIPTEPIIFLKPTTAYVVEGQKIKVKAQLLYFELFSLYFAFVVCYLLLSYYQFLPTRRYASAVLTVIVCLSFVCLSQVDVLLRWLNLGSRK